LIAQLSLVALKLSVLDAACVIYPTEEQAKEARDFWIAKGKSVSEIERMRKEF
jgi:hypothetical protein